MISTVNRPDENSGRMLEMLEVLLDSLPPGTATLESMRTENDDGTVIRLKPINKHAAEFGVHTEDGLSLIDVFFGNGTTLELPWDAELPENADIDAKLDVVRNIALAVIAGKCEERFGFMSIRGTIRVNAEKVYRRTHYFYPRSYPKTVRYEAYCSTAAKS